jgi:hypothetical protein
MTRSTPPAEAMRWQRDGARQSFLAPQICLHQALTASGRTASGVGATPGEARARAFSETAEIVALESAAGAALPRRFLPTRDGIAAHPEPAQARMAAFLEACERRGVSDWWLGHGAPAAPLAPGWLTRTGLSDWLADTRRGADLRRSTALWRLPAPPPLTLVVARSLGAGGQAPMLGYGCAPEPEEAARKALREVLLMEICVMDDYVARAFGAPLADDTARRQMADFAARLPALLPEGPAVVPVAEDSASLHAALRDGATPPRAMIGWLGGPLAFTDLPVSGSGRAVTSCQPLGARPVLMPGPGSPFVGGPAPRAGRGPAPRAGQGEGPP